MREYAHQPLVRRRLLVDVKVNFGAIIIIIDDDAPMFGLNEGRIFDKATGKLGEGLAECGDALGLHLEVTLLCHGGVPAGTIDVSQGG